MSSYIRDRVERWWQSLDQGQHIALSFFAPCAVLTLVLAVVSLRTSIHMPFRAPKQLLQNSQDLLARQRADAEALRLTETAKDTDGDGILDQDEVNVFRTSAYLTDTDSDGVTDGEEVRLGTDPNCPPDRDCYGFVTTNADAMPVAGGDEPSTTGTAPTLEQARPPETLSPQEIRAYFARTGLAPAEQVAALPDEGVVELYRRVYEQLRSVNTVDTSGTGSVGSQSSPSTSP